MQQSRILPTIVLLTLAACSASGYRESADREVYEIVEKRRNEVLNNPGVFTIDRPAQTLRSEWLSTPPASRPVIRLTLVKALQVAAENSRDFQDQKETVYFTALDLTLERYRLGYIPALRGSAGVVGTGEQATEASAVASPSLTKVLGTGARIVANIGIGIFKSLLTSDGFHTLPTTISLGVTQPLLRGGGASIVEEPLTQNERDVVYSVRQFERFRQTFAISVVTQLYRILQEQDTVHNEKANYDNLTRVRERNEALHKAGRLSDVEVGQARQNELSARNRWINAQQDLGGFLDQFKILLGLPTESELEIDNAELVKLQKAGLSDVTVLERAAFAVALKRRLDFQTTFDRVADFERRVHVAEDALSMGVDLTGNYSASSPNARPFAVDLRQSKWNVGFNIDLPIDRLPERNAYRSSLILLESEKRAASLATDNLRLQIRNALREIDQTKESYKIQKLSVELAESRVKSAELYLQAGRSSTRDLLEAQEALVAAQNALTKNLIDFTIAKLSLVRDIGALVVDEAGISINELLLKDASVEQGEPERPDAPRATLQD
ncbi:MAG: TolC family protein [Planctomycetes bacterium]|nr:TolC family protein [Planctomycetota bacterium]